MKLTKEGVENRGAIIDLFLQDARPGQGGFHQSSRLMNPASDNHLNYFNGNFPEKKSRNCHHTISVVLKRIRSIVNQS